MLRKHKFSQLLCEFNKPLGPRPGVGIHVQYRLCALIFLIGKLPQEGPADLGIRATADMLADLLVRRGLEISCSVKGVFTISALRTELIGADNINQIAINICEFMEISQHLSRHGA